MRCAALTVISNNKIDLEHKLNNTLSEVATWFKANKLSLNIAKSKVMCFATHSQLIKTSEISVQYDNVRLEKVSHYKYLGVILDSNLSFSHHVEYIESKVLKRISILSRARHFLNKDTCIYLYRQLILPLMDCCDHVYEETTQKCKDVLQKLQNSAIRCILYADRLTPTTVLHDESDTERLEIRRKKHICIFMYKIINDLLPAGLKSFFRFVSEVSCRETRHSMGMNLYISKPRLELNRKSFVYKGAML